MGIIDGLMGNAGELTPAAVKAELEPVLIEGETLARAFRVVRDLIVFTDRRMILVDKQGLTGKKIHYHSFPYRSITRFSAETAGTFDRDAELRIWVSGSDEPIKREFKKGTDIVGVQRMLARHVLAGS